MNNYNTYTFPSQTQQSYKIFGYSLLFLIIGIIITLFVCYLIYEYYLKNNIKNDIPPPVVPPITKINLPEMDLKIDDDYTNDTCIQKRKIYDSDFDRTIYPIDDSEIIYF
jgi:hypothetical protein